MCSPSRYAIVGISSAQTTKVSIRTRLDRGADLDPLLERQQGEGGEGAGEDQASPGDDTAGVDESDAGALARTPIYYRA